MPRMKHFILQESPSPRRAWIEILSALLIHETVVGRPPHGGRGLKYSPEMYRRYDTYVALPTEGVD